MWIPWIAAKITKADENINDKRSYLQTGLRSGLLGGLNSLLDANGDGNALDDILRMAGKTGSR